MMLRINAFQSIQGNVCINLRRRNIGVAKNGLDGSQVGSVLDHVSRARVPEHVGTGVSS